MYSLMTYSLMGPMNLSSYTEWSSWESGIIISGSSESFEMKSHSSYFHQINRIHCFTNFIFPVRNGPLITLINKNYWFVERLELGALHNPQRDEGGAPGYAGRGNYPAAPGGKVENFCTSEWPMQTNPVFTRLITRIKLSFDDSDKSCSSSSVLSSSYFTWRHCHLRYINVRWRWMQNWWPGQRN